MVMAKSSVNTLWLKKKKITRTRHDELREILIKFYLKVRVKVPILGLNGYISMKLLFSTLVKSAINQWYNKVK